MNKIDELHILVNQFDPSIIIIVETWLSEAADSSYLGLKSYVTHHKDRANGTDPHGGILIAVKKSLTNTCVKLETNREILAIDIINKYQQKFRTIAAYSEMV